MLKKLNKRKTAIILIVFALAYSIYLYNKPHINIEKAPTELKIEASDLIASFIHNEKKANSDFVEKVIEIEGIIKEVRNKDNTNTIYLETMIDSSHVICEMQKNQDLLVSSLKQNEKVKIKGICKGYLQDAIVLNCILVANE